MRYERTTFKRRSCRNVFEIDQTTIAIGVGLDTARYGHHATFLREDRQPAAEPLEFLECRGGYQRLEEVLTAGPAAYQSPTFTSASMRRVSMP